MKIKCLFFSKLTLLVIGLLFISTYVYADNTSQFNEQIKAYQQDRNKVESQLGIVENIRKVSVFHEGYMGHYEIEQKVKQDMLNKGKVFNEGLKPLQANRAQVEAQLGITEVYQHASSYYDDEVDHFEQGQLMRDVIDGAIR